MKFLIQRVTRAQVDIDGETVGHIDGKGFLVLIGVGEGDTKEIADRLVKKMLALRISPMKTARRTFPSRT